MRSIHRRIAFVTFWMGVFCCATGVRAQTSTSQDGFNPGTGTSPAIAVKASGKIVVSSACPLGPVQTYRYICQLNEDGSRDVTFDQILDNAVYDLAVQPDGKILIAGDFTTVNNGATPRNRIARLNADLSLDTSFNPAAGADQRVYSLALQPDGKIVVGGDFLNLAGASRQHIGRLNADGSLDAAFDPGADNTVLALAVQPDGRIVVGGAFTSLGGGGAGSNNQTAIGRLFADGRPDLGFPPNANQIVSAIALQPDGKIVVGGMFTTLGPAASPAGRSRIARLNADGSVDAAFDPGANALVFALAVQPDGKILAGGDFTLLGGGGSGVASHERLGRLNADGSPDVTFGASANGTVAALAVQPSGSILVGGAFTTLGGGVPGPYPRNGIGRVYPGGSLDLDFTPAASPTGGYVTAFAVQPDGKILVGGHFTAIGGALRNYVARFTPDGYPDSFNPDANGAVRAFAIQPDGKIVVGGSFTSIGGLGCSRFARLNPGGTVDSCFSAAASGDVYALALQADGKILVAGNFFAVGGEAHSGLARLNADTSVDAAFTAGANSWINTIAVQHDGKILVGGAFTSLAGGTRHGVGRLNADGSLDTSFADPNFGDAVTSIALQADGKIVVGGHFINGIRRLNADGTTDSSFIASTNGIVYTMVVQADGKIVVGGTFTLVTGVAMSRFVRLNANGTVDDESGFGSDANGEVRALAMQADGKILAGGTFTFLNNQPRQYIGRVTNTSAATQALSVIRGGSRISWLRGGVGQELASVTFEYSTDGVTYTLLEAPIRTPGGWTLAGIGLPSKTNVFIRARGFGRGGLDNGSGSMVESVLNAYFGTGFTDDPIVAAATPIRAVHIQELRARIDTVRARYGLAPFAYGNPANADIIPGVSVVSAADVTQMRTALAPAYTMLGLAAPVYSTSPAPGIMITVADIAELRAALLGIE